MFERLRKILSADRRERLGHARYRLCRLRHATLHPGAWLWTPGVGGGNLGAGADAALEEAGIGGEVVVAFQTQARMPLHPQGVLARVEAVAPFPEDWESDGLGAAQRYRLLGLQRVDLDVATTTNKRVPTVEGTTMVAHPDELEPPSAEQLELLRALAAIDNHWPPHWLEAFELLPESPLAQWATSLGWRLTAEERLTLFDYPDRIAETIYSTLDSLRVGLDPQRRREAVRRQTHTRRTTLMPERIVTVQADPLGWSWFHPADIAPQDGEGEGVDAPAPVAAPVAAPVEEPDEDAIVGQFARGNLVAVRVDTPGMTRLRLTSGELTADELAERRADATFRLHVRHGRLFLGRGELAHGRHFQDNVAYADPTQWIDVPDGLYRAVVTRLIPRPAAPVAEPPAIKLDYVVQLVRVDTLDGVPFPDAVPHP